MMLLVLAVIDIANPLGPGHHLVGHGRSNTLVNGHKRTFENNVEQYRPWREQSYAVDFIAATRALPGLSRRPVG